MTIKQLRDTIEGLPDETEIDFVRVLDFRASYGGIIEPRKILDVAIWGYTVGVIQEKDEETKVSFMLGLDIQGEEDKPRPMSSNVRVKI